VDSKRRRKNVSKQSEAHSEAQSTRDAGTGQRGRRTGAERRQQIAEAALLLIARHGLQGTTVSRIADEVGLEAPSLYVHFSSRQEILLAAVDALFARVGLHLASSSDSNVLNRLRDLGMNHAEFLTAQFEGFVIPIFEFMTAPRDSGLGEAMGARQRQTIDVLAAWVEEGKGQGTLRADADSKLVAYQMMLLFWAEDVTQLMGIDEFIKDGFSRRILEQLLSDIAAEPGSSGGEPAPVE
jgi:AcrR family transcriptional regulator